MSSSIDNEEHDPVANLTMLPVRSILKPTKSIDESQLENKQDTTLYSTTGMKRSESKSHKIPHFDEMNIIATYHPIDKDYGHMKIEEPKTPYAPCSNLDEKMETDFDNDETISSGVDPDALAQRLHESSIPSCTDSSRSYIDHSPGKSSNEISTDIEHRKQFENHRKQHYNEFEVVRLRKKEIEEELRALEQDEDETHHVSHTTDSIKPILVHSSSPSHHPHHHHVHVDEDYDYEIDEQTLTPEERERRKQFQLKRKQHYNEFIVVHSANKDDEK
ncbi:unnamed protein product [Adineta steineri]|uniref:Protein phosphatase inhibitor 2 n=1 Tax=Adineta steineri TaxID=433720 RepID=A0A815V3J6_9BILA|nr:unnamed protein product [Adineta steineri]